MKKFKSGTVPMRHQNLFFPKEKTYYIDENGEMVTGWKDIDNFRYFFR